jgi:hypothetical protein
LFSYHWSAIPAIVNTLERQHIQNILVKGDKVLHNPLLVFIPDGGRDQSLQLVVIQHPADLQTLITQSGKKVVVLSTGLDIMLICKGQVQRTDQLRVIVDDLKDIVRGKGLLAQATLNLGQGFGVDTVIGVEERRESRIFRA